MQGRNLELWTTNTLRITRIHLIKLDCFSNLELFFDAELNTSTGWIVFKICVFIAF